MALEHSETPSIIGYVADDDDDSDDDDDGNNYTRLCRW